METSISVLLALKDYLEDIYPNLTTWTPSNNGTDVCPPFIHNDSRTNTSFLLITLKPNLENLGDDETEDNLKSSLPKTFDRDLVATSIYRLPWISRSLRLVLSPMAIVTQQKSCRSLISISLVSHHGHLITKEFVKFSISFEQIFDAKKVFEEAGISDITMTHSDLLWKISKFSESGLKTCPGIVHKTHKSLSTDAIYIEPTPASDHIVRSRHCSFILQFSQTPSDARCSHCTSLDSMLTETNAAEETVYPEVGILDDEMSDETIREKSERMKSSETETTVYEKVQLIEDTEEVASYASNLVCHNCGTVFLYESSFDKHSVICKGASGSRIKGYHCRNCGETFQSVSAMLDHREDCFEKKATITLMRKPGEKARVKTIGSKSKRKSFQIDPPLVPSNETEETCYVCLRNYQSKDRFEAHLRVHEHDIPELMKQTQCPIETCSRVFDNRPDLNSHFMVDHAIDDLSNKILCLKCLMPVSRDRIRRHFRVNHPNRTYTCEDCGRVCLYPSQLKAHRKEMHDPTNVKPFICHLCGNIYSRATGLSQHMLNQHSDHRQFQCKYCKKGFTSIQRLQQHERIHTGDKPYKCTICGYRSTRKDNVQLHLRKVHKTNPESTLELIEMVST